MVEVNWIRLGKEIGAMPNGIAVLRVLQAHGLYDFRTHRTPSEGGGINQICSIDTVIHYAHTEK